MFFVLATVALMSPIRMDVSYEAQRDLCEDVAQMLGEELKLGRKTAEEVALHVKRCKEFVVEFESRD